MIEDILSQVSSRTMMRIAIVVAVVGFASCLVVAIIQCDARWIGRGGAWITATGAFVLFAEWSVEREIEPRRELAIQVAAILSGEVERRNNQEMAYDTTPEYKVHTVIQRYRLPVVSISAALLFWGALVGGFGEPIIGPLISNSTNVVSCHNSDRANGRSYDPVLR